MCRRWTSSVEPRCCGPACSLPCCWSLHRRLAQGARRFSLKSPRQCGHAGAGGAAGRQQLADFPVGGRATGWCVESSLGYFLTPLVNVLLGLAGAQGTAEPATNGSQSLWRWSRMLPTKCMVLGSLPWVSLALAATFGTYGLVRKRVPAEALARPVAGNPGDAAAVPAVRAVAGKPAGPQRFLPSAPGRPSTFAELGLPARRRGADGGTAAVFCRRHPPPRSGDGRDADVHQPDAAIPHRRLRSSTKPMQPCAAAQFCGLIWLGLAFLQRRALWQKDSAAPGADMSPRLIYAIVFIEGFCSLGAEVIALRRLVPHVGSAIMSSPRRPSVSSCSRWRSATPPAARIAGDYSGIVGAQQLPALRQLLAGTRPLQARRSTWAVCPFAAGPRSPTSFFVGGVMCPDCLAARADRAGANQPARQRRPGRRGQRQQRCTGPRSAPSSVRSGCRCSMMQWLGVSCGGVRLCPRPRRSGRGLLERPRKRQILAARNGVDRGTPAIGDQSCNTRSMPTPPTPNTRISHGRPAKAAKSARLSGSTSRSPRCSTTASRRALHPLCPSICAGCCATNSASGDEREILVLGAGGFTLSLAVTRTIAIPMSISTRRSAEIAEARFPARSPARWRVHRR